MSKSTIEIISFDSNGVDGCIVYKLLYHGVTNDTCNTYTMQGKAHDIRHALRLTNWDGFNYLKSLGKLQDKYPNPLDDNQLVIINIVT